MTGCRRGEALGLTWPDLDIESGRVAIRRALVPIDGKLVETEPKTKRGRRLIALDAETVAVLRQQAARQLAEQQALGDELDRQRAGVHRRRMARSCTPSASAPCLLAWCVPRRCRRSPCTGCAIPTPASPWPRASIRRSSHGGWDTPPWPSPWISTPTCCPRSMPRRRSSSPATTQHEILDRPIPRDAAPCESLAAGRRSTSAASLRLKRVTARDPAVATTLTEPEPSAHDAGVDDLEGKS